MKKILFVLIFGLFGLVFPVYAHQPRIVSGDAPVTINNPEVSQAFYGELKGEDQLFRIDSDKPFKLYTNILVPDEFQIKKDISIQASFEKDGLSQVLFDLSGPMAAWTPFYEPFGGDNYLKGPEKSMPVGEGTYVLRVYSPDNLGRYVLVVGEKEEFPILEALRTIGVLPQLKTQFFGEPAWTAYFNLTGLFMLIPLVIIFILIILIYRVKRRKTKKPEA